MNQNIILYPRSYNKRGDESMHSVQGLDQNGQVINVKLRLSDKMKETPFPPSIIEFSRTDINAKSACIATEDNSPDNRAGVILFSDVSFEKTDTTGMKTYIAKWAVVLANKQDQPSPIFAIGRMNLNKNSQEVRKIKDAIKIAKMKNSSKDDIAFLESKANDPKHFSYPVITYHPETTVTVNASSISHTMDAVKGIISNDGDLLIPGVLVRKINKDNEVYKGCHQEFFSKYLFDKMRYQNAHELSGDVANKCFLWSEDIKETDRIQVYRINKIKSGPVANQFYSEPKRLKTLGYYYLNSKNKPVVCNVAIRISEAITGAFLYRVYPLSMPIGEAYKLDENGTEIFQDYGYKAKSLIISNESEIGLQSVAQNPFLGLFNALKTVKDILPEDEETLRKETYVSFSINDISLNCRSKDFAMFLSQGNPYLFPCPLTDPPLDEGDAAEHDDTDLTNDGSEDEDDDVFGEFMSFGVDSGSLNSDVNEVDEIIIETCADELGVELNNNEVDDIEELIICDVSGSSLSDPDVVPDENTSLSTNQDDAAELKKSSDDSGSSASKELHPKAGIYHFISKIKDKGEA